jgi:hypothetical protein
MVNQKKKTWKIKYRNHSTLRSKNEKNHSDLAFYSVRVYFSFNILMMGIKGSL